MRKDYKRIGDFISRISDRNREGTYSKLLGINIDNFFMPSIINRVGVNLKNYKIVKQYQFACNRMHVGRDYRIPIAMSNSIKPFIVSPAYDVFEVTKPEVLMPEYLMLWFKRKEYDRNAWFHTDGDVRGGLPWEAFCDIKINIPSIEKQREIVAEYQAVENKIKTNEQICEKLEAAAQALYKHWFVDFEFPNEEDMPYKSSGGAMVYNEELEKEIPEGWEVKNLSDITKITMGQSPKGETYNDKGIGKVFYQGRTDFGFRIPEIRMYTTDPKRKANKGDVLMSVRAPVGDLNISNTDCCIGRGLASFQNDKSSYIFYLLKNFKSLFDSDKGTGTIFSSINKTELFGLKVIFDENIAQNFHFIVKQIDATILNKSLETKKLSQFQELLLSRMVKN